MLPEEDKRSYLSLSYLCMVGISLELGGLNAIYKLTSLKLISAIKLTAPVGGAVNSLVCSYPISSNYLPKKLSIRRVHIVGLELYPISRTAVLLAGRT